MNLFRLLPVGHKIGGVKVIILFLKISHKLIKTYFLKEQLANEGMKK